MSDTEAKTKDKAETDETVDAKPAAAPQEAATEGAEPTKVRLEEVDLAEKMGEDADPERNGAEKKDFKPLILKALALVVFVGISAAAIYFLRGGIEVETPVEEPKTIDSRLRIDPTLSARELIQFGNEALRNSDVREASRFYEGARLRANLESPNDVNLTVEVYEGLAKVEVARGNDGTAKMLRDYILSLQATLGKSLSIFNEAEKQYRAANHVEARKLYARFLLTSDSLEEGGKRYIDSAKRRIADSFEQERADRYAKKSPPSLTNPTEFFHVQ